MGPTTRDQARRHVRAQEVSAARPVRARYRYDAESGRRLKAVELIYPAVPAAAISMPADASSPLRTVASTYGCS